MEPNVFHFSSPFKSAGGRRFRKELIRAGTWHKGDQQWTVDEALLSHWADTFREFTGDGNKVPVPVEHTTDPEANRGYVVGMEVAASDDGTPALFGMVEFAEGYEHLAKTTDVSIYSPQEHPGGNGKRYTRPITHVALTTQPVVTGLGNFEPIAASFGEPKMSEKEMAFSKDFLKKMARKLEIELDDNFDEAAAETAFLKAFRAKQKAEKAEPAKDDEDADKGKRRRKKETAVAASFTPPPAMVAMLRENREMKLSRLVDEGRITKAVRDDLHKQFCGDECLSLSLSGTADAFDSVVASLAKNEPSIAFKKERTGAQAVALSHSLRDGKNPVVEGAKRRAEAAKK